MSDAKESKIQTRAMVKSTTVKDRKSDPALPEEKQKVNMVKGKQKVNMIKGKQKVNMIKEKQKVNMVKIQELSQVKQEPVHNDIFHNAMEAKAIVQRATGLVYDESMSQNCCLWDVMHPDLAERFTIVLERCKELHLVKRCQVIPSRRATKAEFKLLHTAEDYKRLEVISDAGYVKKMEEMSSENVSIFIHLSTFDLSLLALGSTIDLIEQIVAGGIQNGMAIIRPPRHHAKKAEFNAFYFFNNVAAGARYALDILKVRKIMIVDWDVHHGHGTQRYFYNDARVLYFSIHRYEHGNYWPKLKESDFDAIGKGPGEGYNFNVPLNKTGMGNGDFMAIFQQILIPVAVEYQPELIIISAGYDAAIGCPEGEMAVTPAFYPHLLNPLLQLAQSRIAVLLEGGYCLDSLAEGAALTLRALLGDPCPLLVEPLEPPCAEIQDAILNCIYAHRPYWKCMQLQSQYTLKQLNSAKPPDNLHKVGRNFVVGPLPPKRLKTSGTAPMLLPSAVENSLQHVRLLKAETKLVTPKVRVCYVYDDLMLQHANNVSPSHPEHPQRIKKIHEMQLEYGLTKRMQLLPSRIATTDEICLVHARDYVSSVRRPREKDELEAMADKYNSVYFHQKTFESATLAAGSVLQVVDKVLCGDARSGICIVRPPGHHAEANGALGFCIFNNVAIAAQYALHDHGLKRVLIVDWDVHHGNGTQHIFKSNPQVLFISVHRYDRGKFYPNSSDANYNIVGDDAGVGFNVNIPWNMEGMGDMEYIMAFQQLIMPIAYEFDPQLVLVSAGFDAAVGDPLGGCNVTPEAFGLFTHWLSALANGRIVVCLEGGYNVNSISYAMTMCTKSLLGDPIPPVQANDSGPSKPTRASYGSCVQTLQRCLKVQQRHWKSLVFNKRLPKSSYKDNNNNEDFPSASLNNLDTDNDDDVPCSIGCSHSVDPHPMPEANSSKPKQ